MTHRKYKIYLKKLSPSYPKRILPSLLLHCTALHCRLNGYMAEFAEKNKAAQLKRQVGGSLASAQNEIDTRAMKGLVAVSAGSHSYILMYIYIFFAYISMLGLYLYCIIIVHL